MKLLSIINIPVQADNEAKLKRTEMSSKIYLNVFINLILKETVLELEEAAK